MPNGDQRDAEPGIEPYPSSTGPGFWAALSVAVVVIVVHLALSGFLIFHADDIADDRLWARLVYVAGGLGALVSTAVGWLFGHEVHRAAAEHATKEAGMARRRAINARGEADAGRALAKAITALPDPTAATRDLAQQASEVGSAASHLLVLKRMAEELFPSEAVVEETRPASPNGR